MITGAVAAFCTLTFEGATLVVSFQRLESELVPSPVTPLGAGAGVGAG
jgi:hypothetical protein